MQPLRFGQQNETKHWINLPLAIFWLCSSFALSAYSDDGDGVPDGRYYVSVANEDQLDTDSDGLGTRDVDDGDGVIDSLDVFPLDERYSTEQDSDQINDEMIIVPISNEDQADYDKDGFGDICAKIPTLTALMSWMHTA